MKKIKNIFIRVGIMCVTASLCALSAFASDGAGAADGFNDVSEEAWYFECVNFAAENGLMDGVGGNNFEPGGHMTRAMMATVLYRIAGTPDMTGEQAYSDVAKGSWYETGVIWASQTGVMTGYGDNVFGPNDILTREQLATVLWRYAGSPEATETEFSDSEEISSWAVAAAAWAQENGIMEGRPGGIFDPEANTTRAEAAAVLSRYYQNFVSTPEDPEGPDVPEDPGETDTPDENEPPLEPENPDGGIEGIRPNEYISEAFVVNNGYLTYVGGTPSFVGVDVSSHQGGIDWQQVADSGVDFAMIRAGYRGYTAGGIYQDLYFHRNMSGAQAAGIDTGIYFFSQAVTPDEAREEARQVLAMIDGYNITYPIAFDWERVDSSTSRTKDVQPETATQCARAFCQVIEDAGYTAIIYGGASKLGVDMSLELLAEYPLWFANYTLNWQATSFPYHYDMWQYTSSGNVPGIDGRVDLNICLVDWSAV